MSILSNITELLTEASAIRKEQLLNKKSDNKTKDVYLSKIISLSKELQKDYSEELETIKASIDEKSILYDSRQDSFWKKEGWAFVKSLDNLLFKTTKGDVLDLDKKYHLFQAAKVLISDSEEDELTKDQMMDTILPYQKLNMIKPRNESIKRVFGEGYDIQIKDNSASIKGDWRYIDEVLESLIEGGFSQIEFDIPLDKFKEKYGDKFKFKNLGKVEENDRMKKLIGKHPKIAAMIAGWMPKKMLKKYEEEYQFNDYDGNPLIWSYVGLGGGSLLYATSDPLVGLLALGVLATDFIIRVTKSGEIGSFITKPLWFMKEIEMLESGFGEKNRVMIELTSNTEEKYNPKSALEFIYNIKIPEEINKNLVKDPENANFNQYGQKFQKFVHDKYANVIVKDVDVRENELEEKIDRTNKGFTVSHSQDLDIYRKDMMVMFKAEGANLITLISENKDDKRETIIKALDGDTEQILRNNYNPQYLDIRRSK